MTQPSPDFLNLQAALAGEYSIQHELGRGGMGVVYLAREVQLDRMPASGGLMQRVETLRSAPTALEPVASGDGDVWAFTVAGAVASPDKPENPTAAAAPSSPAPGAPALPGTSSSSRSASATAAGSWSAA